MTQTGSPLTLAFESKNQFLIAGNVDYSIPYQKITSDLKFLYASPTNAGDIFVCGGSGTGAAAPSFVAPSTLTVGNATSAVTATNLAGGILNAIPIQTATGTTNFLQLQQLNFTAIAPLAIASFESPTLKFGVDDILFDYITQVENTTLNAITDSAVNWWISKGVTATDALAIYIQNTNTTKTIDVTFLYHYQPKV